MSVLDSPIPDQPERGNFLPDGFRADGLLPIGIPQPLVDIRLHVGCRHALHGFRLLEVPQQVGDMKLFRVDRGLAFAPGGIDFW